MGNFHGSEYVPDLKSIDKAKQHFKKEVISDERRVVPIDETYHSGSYGNWKDCPEYYFWHCCDNTDKDAPGCTIGGDLNHWNRANGGGAVRGHSSATTLTIPEGVKTIGDDAFQDYSSATTLTIPGGVETIGARAFYGCSSVLTFAIPEGVRHIGDEAFADCSSITTLTIPEGVKTIGVQAFHSCPLLTVLLIQPTNDAAAPHSTTAIIKAFNEQNQFPNVAKIWATDAIIAQLNGPFEAYDQFKDAPRALRAAPDATTWAGVQLWRWWLPPSLFSMRGGVGGDDDRVVCTSRTTTIWTVMLSAYKSSEVLDVLPDLEPELWEHIFTFLKHDQQPSYFNGGAASAWTNYVASGETLQYMVLKKTRGEEQVTQDSLQVPPFL